MRFVLALLLLAAPASAADCLHPWDAARFAATPASGQVAVYQWRVNGSIAQTTTEPRTAIPCPAGDVRVRALDAAGNAGPWSTPYPDRVQCMGLVPGEGLWSSQFAAWDEGFLAGWLVCR